MNRCRRTIFFIDAKVQGALLARTTIYWMFCLFSVSLMLMCWKAFTGPPMRFVDLMADLFNRFGPGLVASLVLLPVALMDVLRLSNRFVGPVGRLRKGLKDLASGNRTEPLLFSDDDFWREMAGDFNEVAAKMAVAASREPAQTERIDEPALADCRSEAVGSR
jgi:hypothetical protein